MKIRLYFSFLVESSWPAIQFFLNYGTLIRLLKMRNNEYRVILL